MTGEAWAERRARVLVQLGERGAMILPAAPELTVGRDTELRYSVDPDLYYLTGYTEPEAVAVLCPSNEAASFTLFVRPRDPAQELWSGVRGGVEAAAERYGADAAHPLGELEERLPKLLAGADTLYFRLGTGRHEIERLVRRVLIGGRKSRQRKGRGPHALVDPGAILDDMRLRKDEAEIHLLREAARITVEGFREAAAAIRPGAGEWAVEAALEAGFRRRGAAGPAFPTIAAAGANATVLHYIENASRLRDGELILLDGGARSSMYCGDISRTFPVNGRFSPAQRDLYDAVLAARHAGIAAVRPGATVAEIHRAALRSLVGALVEHGLLRGVADELVEDEQAYKPFFPHQTSHWLGLDVHDVGDYTVDGRPRPLQPGMVLTIEPGLYLPAAATDVPPELRGTGIRIEDDVLVTAEGCEVLTAALPAAADAVEGMVGQGG
jgi:Xaa-Pro aminopeptidase